MTIINEINIIETIVNLLSIVAASLIAIITVYYETRKTEKREKQNKSDDIKREFLIKLLEEYNTLVQLIYDWRKETTMITISQTEITELNNEIIHLYKQIGKGVSDNARIITEKINSYLL